MNFEYSFRTVNVKDAPRLLEIYSPYVEKSSVSFEYEVPSLKEFKSRIKNISKKFPYIVCIVEGKIAGYCYAGTFHARAAYDCSVELSIYVAKEFQGKGIGRLLYGEMEKLLKERNVTTLYACIAATPRDDDPYLTDASIKFHGKMGYKLCGRFTECAVKYGLKYDMVYMEKHI